MELTPEDVLEILGVIESSNVDYLELETHGLRLIASNHAIGERRETEVTPAKIDDFHTASVQAPGDMEPAQSPSVPSSEEAREDRRPIHSLEDESLFTVVAPMVGVLYWQSEPGAAPYAEIGSEVKAGDTVGLLEVMKMFTTVCSDRDGVVVEILASNGELVEYEQPLVVLKGEGAA